MSVIHSRGAAAAPTSTAAPAAAGARDLVDPRGLRFGAAVTTVVLALVLLLLPSSPAVVLLAVQAVVFGIGAARGLRHQPYGVVFRRLVRPRLRPPLELEDGAPPRFAQTVGLVFAGAGLIGTGLGLLPLAYVAVAAALAAALLNAAFDFCLGCELYLLAVRLRHRARTT